MPTELRDEAETVGALAKIEPKAEKRRSMLNRAMQLANQAQELERASNP